MLVRAQSIHRHEIRSNQPIASLSPSLFLKSKLKKGRRRLCSLFKAHRIDFTRVCVYVSRWKFCPWAVLVNYNCISNGTSLSWNSKRWCRGEKKKWMTSRIVIQAGALPKRTNTVSLIFAAQKLLDETKSFFFLGKEGVCLFLFYEKENPYLLPFFSPSLLLPPLSFFWPGQAGFSKG